MIDPAEHDEITRELELLHFRLGEAEHSLSVLQVTLDATEELLGEAMDTIRAIYRHARWAGIENGQGDWWFIEGAARDMLDLNSGNRKQRK